MDKIKLGKAVGEVLVIIQSWAVVYLIWTWYGMYEAGGALTLLFGLYLWVKAYQLDQDNHNEPR
jgi:hypothetical protein